MGYNLVINWVCWGYNLLTNPLLTSWDIQVGASVDLRTTPLLSHQMEWKEQKTHDGGLQQCFCVFPKNLDHFLE